MIKIAYFEDNQSDVKRLKEILHQHEDLFTAKHFSDYKSLHTNVKDFAPQIALLDIAIGGEQDAGITAIGIIREILPHTRIIMLTDMIDFVWTAFQQGANGYIMKNDLWQSIEFIEDIATTTVFSPQVIDRIVADTRTKESICFTATEERIIYLSSIDYGVKQITEHLRIARPKLTNFAVESYIRNIKAKLQCNTIQGVVGKCWYHNLLDFRKYSEGTD